MKLHLLHGPGKTGSRKKLIEEKATFDPCNVVVFEEGVDVQDVIDNLISTSLFADERLVVLENPPEDFTNFPLFPNHYTLVLWFDHELSDKTSTLKWVKGNKGEILFFPESQEKSIFPFLDLLTQNSPKAFIELKNLQEGHEKFSDMQYLLTMVFYLLRTLAVTPKNASTFVKQKLEKQRKNFNLEKITELYNAMRYKTRSDVIASYYKDILEIDFKIKSGLLEKEQAEFLLVNKFL